MKRVEGEREALEEKVTRFKHDKIHINSSKNVSIFLKHKNTYLYFKNRCLVEYFSCINTVFTVLLLII